MCPDETPREPRGGASHPPGNLRGWGGAFLHLIIYSMAQQGFGGRSHWSLFRWLPWRALAGWLRQEVS